MIDDANLVARHDLIGRSEDLALFECATRNERQMEMSRYEVRMRCISMQGRIKQECAL